MNRFPPKHILVPMDFTHPSFAALNCAMLLGILTDAALDIVYVFDLSPNMSSSGKELTITPEQYEEHRRLVERDLKRAAADYPPERLSIEIHKGTPSEVLTRLSNRKDCDLVVMGTHGYTGMNRVLYGSVAENVVRSSTTPVLTLHKDSRFPHPKRLLVPLNLTDYADRALQYALKVAETTKAEVSVLYVVEMPSQRVEAQAKLKEHLNRLLGEKQAAAVTGNVRDGNPQEIILEEAEAISADMIVLSAHQKPFWKDWVLGMTAERVLRHSTIPILAVPSSSKSRTPAA